MFALERRMNRQNRGEEKEERYLEIIRNLFYKILHDKEELFHTVNTYNLLFKDKIKDKNLLRMIK